MRIPQISGFANFASVKNKGVFVQNPQPSKFPKPDDREIKKDEVTFSSIAYYLKKYNTLPDEIKEILSPKDAIVMFEDMEHIANGSLRGEKIGQGLYSKVYLNPWLEDYYILILDSPTNKDQYIYSKVPLGDSIWEDKDNQRIQLIKNAAA